MDWNYDLSKAFLPIPWSTTATCSVLVKLLYQPRSRELSLLATDLDECYHEHLRGRQLNRRVDDAVSSKTQSTQSESMGVMAGVGPDGEALVDRVIAELVDGVTSGKSRIDYKEEMMEHFVDISLASGGCFRFVLFRLGSRSSSIVTSHLIRPLIGTSTALLALLHQLEPDEEELASKIDSAIESSASAERFLDGQNCSTFVEIGGSVLLSRWEQAHSAVNKIEPERLATHTSPPKSALKSPTKSSSPPPPPVSPSKGFAKRMLDHKSKSAGERVRWEDSQTDEVTDKKGKGRAEDPLEAVVRNTDERIPKSSGRREMALEEDEPATDEEDSDFSSLRNLSLPPSSQPERTIASPSPTPSRRSPLKHPSPFPPTPSGSSSLPQDSPSPPRPTQPEPAEDSSPKKKRKAAQEEDEALKKRKAKFALLKQAKGGSKTGSKKLVGSKGL